MKRFLYIAAALFVVLFLIDTKVQAPQNDMYIIQETIDLALPDIPGPQNIPDRPKIFKLTEEERRQIATLVYLEGGNQSFECQQAICSVIFNRWQNGYWGETLEETIYAPEQFTPAFFIDSTTPRQEQYEVVDSICEFGTTLPSYVMYFRANYYFDWATPYCYYDDTYFSFLDKDKK